MSHAELPPSAEPNPVAPMPRYRLQDWCLLSLTVMVAAVLVTALKPVFTPLLVAIFLLLLLNPVVDRIAGLGLPRGLAYVVMTVLVAMLIYGGARVLETNIQAVAENFPRYRSRTLELIDSFARLTNLANEQGTFDWERYAISDLFNVSERSLLTHLAGATFTIVEQATMAVFYLLFLFMEAERLPGRIRKSLSAETSTRVLEAMRHIKDDLWRFLVVKTLVSAGLGLSTALICWAAGVDFWLLWGVLMFLANYITYLGSIAALIPPLLTALVQFESLGPVILLAVVLAICRFVWIDYVEIRYSGRHVNVSPLILLFSIALLGWTWGVVGMLLAVPLVTSVRIGLASFEETRHLAGLMSDS